MSNAHLRPCAGCARHIRVSESACPFCGSTLDAAFRSSPAPVRPSGRLTRAALLAIGTAAVAAGPVACSSDKGTETPDANFNVSDAYGMPDTNPFDAGREGGEGVSDAYGIAPFDAGHDANLNVSDAYGMPDTNAFDATEDAPEDTGPPMVDAAYGGPPLDSGEKD